MAHCLGPLMLLFCFESASGPEKCAPESKLSHQNRSTSGTIEAHHASSWIGYSSSPILFSHYLRSHPTQPDERQRQRERSMRDHRPGGEINHSKMNNFDFTKWIDSLSPHCTEQGGRSLWTWKLTWKKKPPLADLFLRSSTTQFRSSLNEEKTWASIDHGYRLIWTNWKVKHFLSHTDIYIHKHTHKSIWRLIWRLSQALHFNNWWTEFSSLHTRGTKICYIYTWYREGLISHEVVCSTRKNLFHR